ncbi:Os01g0351100 [Oryza sativa Japonica Group]|nr:Os01g0351100 [Oryza sativa Japonica Group]|eukprot:NP_001042983.2 Os01g0351100 [Oryza sativa Japonica Group]
MWTAAGRRLHQQRDLHAILRTAHRRCCTRPIGGGLDAPAAPPGDLRTLSGVGMLIHQFKALLAPKKIYPWRSSHLQSLEVRRLHTAPSNAAAAAAVTDGGDQDKTKSAKDDDGDDKVQCKKEKIVTATKKGAAVLDQYIPDNIKTAYHVLQVGDEIYDATMNQTNVGGNNNKFYIIQALESDAGGNFMVYSRWGRVGTRDIHWSYRKGSHCYAHKYTWLEMDYGEADKETNKKTSSITNQLEETKLETRTASFISLICDISMMKQQMVEIGYNADKLPLGKLSKSTILKGYDVLKRISNVISGADTDRTQLEQLTGEFYSVIPHDFGFKKMSEFIIDTPQKLKAKLEMVEALSEIEIAIKLLEDDSSDQDHPLYARYKQFCCDFTPLEVDSEEYSMARERKIKTYLTNTHGKTHTGYTVDIVQIFKVSRLGEMERFQKFASAGNRMLLWHGSRLTNWAGILSQGLRIAPPEAPISGFMFGKGVYFADMFSKSANYCCASEACKSGVMLLCEVALGEMNELLYGDFGADNLPNGKLSTKGVGQTEPNIAESKITDDGMVIPLGKPEKGSLMYNEYIVYNVDQIRMRYILNVNFNFKRWG